jgi:quercetin dioxygenase-like cupin family protein
MTSQPAPSDDGITRVFDYPLSQRVQALRVDYAPGESTDWRHVHPAGAFVYVLEGSVRMGLEGEDVQTLEPGDSWHETPGTVHSVSENASEPTRRACSSSSSSPRDRHRPSRPTE